MEGMVEVECRAGSYKRTILVLIFLTTHRYNGPAFRNQVNHGIFFQSQGQSLSSDEERWHYYDFDRGNSFSKWSGLGGMRNGAEAVVKYRFVVTFRRRRRYSLRSHFHFIYHNPIFTPHKGRRCLYHDTGYSALKLVLQEKTWTLEENMETWLEPV